MGTLKYGIQINNGVEAFGTTGKTITANEECDVAGYKELAEEMTHFSKLTDQESNEYVIKNLMKAIVHEMCRGKRVVLPIGNDNKAACAFHLDLHLANGNINETISDDEALAYLMAGHGIYSTDGGINNHPLMSNPSGSTGTPIASSNKLNFLDQDNQMYVLQEGLGAEYSLKKYPWGQLTFSVSYLFEWIRNKGVDADIFPGQGSGITLNGDGTYQYGGSQYSGSDLVNLFKNQWKGGFRDVINNYFSIGVKYQY